MPLFSKKHKSTPKNASSSSSSSSLSSQSPPNNKHKKKERVLELELMATGFVFGRGTNAGGWYRPFVQITNAAGQVVGRSTVLPEVATTAHWPVLRLSWKRLLLVPPLPNSTTTTTTTTTTNVATTSSSSSSRSVATWNSSTSTRSLQSDASLLSVDDNVVLAQPLLLVVYDYYHYQQQQNDDNNAKHGILGRIPTTLQQLMDKAKDLHAAPTETVQGLLQRHAPPSFTLPFSSSSSSSNRNNSKHGDDNKDKGALFGALYVKRLDSTRGKADALSETAFAPYANSSSSNNKADVIWKKHPWLTDLEQAVPPRGLSLAGGLSLTQQQEGPQCLRKQLSKLSVTEVDETEDTTCYSQEEEEEYGDNDDKNASRNHHHHHRQQQQKHTDENKEDTAPTVMDKDALRRERAQAMIAAAQARVQKMKNDKKKKSKRLVEKNMKRAAVRFGSFDDGGDGNDDDDRQEIGNEEPLDSLNSLLTTKGVAAVLREKAQKQKQHVRQQTNSAKTTRHATQKMRFT